MSEFDTFFDNVDDDVTEGFNKSLYEKVLEIFRGSPESPSPLPSEKPSEKPHFGDIIKERKQKKEDYETAMADGTAVGYIPVNATIGDKNVTVYKWVDGGKWARPEWRHHKFNTPDDISHYKQWLQINNIRGIEEAPIPNSPFKPWMEHDLPPNLKMETLLHDIHEYAKTQAHRELRLEKKHYDFNIGDGLDKKRKVIFNQLLNLPVFVGQEFDFNLGTMEVDFQNMVDAIMGLVMVRDSKAMRTIWKETMNKNTAVGPDRDRAGGSSFHNKKKQYMKDGKNVFKWIDHEDLTPGSLERVFYPAVEAYIKNKGLDKEPDVKPQSETMFQKMQDSWENFKDSAEETAYRIKHGVQKYVRLAGYGTLNYIITPSIATALSYAVMGGISLYRDNPLGRAGIRNNPAFQNHLNILNVIEREGIDSLIAQQENRPHGSTFAIRDIINALSDISRLAPQEAVPFLQGLLDTIQYSHAGSMRRGRARSHDISGMLRERIDAFIAEHLYHYMPEYAHEIGKWGAAIGLSVGGLAGHQNMQDAIEYAQKLEKDANTLVTERIEERRKPKPEPRPRPRPRPRPSPSPVPEPEEPEILTMNGMQYRKVITKVTTEPDGTVVTQYQLKPVLDDDWIFKHRQKFLFKQEEDKIRFKPKKRGKKASYARRKERPKKGTRKHWYEMDPPVFNEEMEKPPVDDVPPPDSVDSTDEEPEPPPNEPTEDEPAPAPAPAPKRPTNEKKKPWKDDPPTPAPSRKPSPAPSSVPFWDDPNFWDADLDTDYPVYGPWLQSHAWPPRKPRTLKRMLWEDDITLPKTPWMWETTLAKKPNFWEIDLGPEAEPEKKKPWYWDSFKDDQNFNDYQGDIKDQIKQEKERGPGTKSYFVRIPDAKPTRES